MGHGSSLRGWGWGGGGGEEGEDGEEGEEGEAAIETTNGWKVGGPSSAAGRPAGRPVLRAVTVPHGGLGPCSVFIGAAWQIEERPTGGSAAGVGSNVRQAWGAVDCMHGAEPQLPSVSCAGLAKDADDGAYFRNTCGYRGG